MAESKYLQDAANHGKVWTVLDEDDVLEAPLLLVAGLVFFLLGSRTLLATNDRRRTGSDGGDGSRSGWNRKQPLSLTFYSSEAFEN